MEMEEKDSTDLGYPVSNSESGSPPSSGGGFGEDHAAAAAGGGGVVQEIFNMAVKTSMAMAGVTVGGVGGGPIGVSGDVMMGRKKRGRPRKFDSDGNLRASYVRSPRLAAAQPGFSLSTSPSYEYTSSSKKGRGRPLDSGQALGSLVYTGEDVAGTILTFAQKGSRGVCVLSANGSVSNVTIRQPGSSGGLLSYEGRFEILTLTGSYTVSDNGGIKSRTGGLSVSLASPDGRVIGGCLAGMLMAAAPIQVVIGSFVPNGYQMPKRKQQNIRRISSPSFQFAPVTVTAAIPISQAAPASNVYPIPTTSQVPVQRQGGEADKDYRNSASTDDSSDWNDSGPSSDQRPSPDINIPIPVVEEH
ncbi:putative DNA-binding protein escarola [Phtheirospermum japonicum]|uniref:AT-hook motif nuclear-localized protein n=1 Tax=Phtheirospermum japonicum TaxID=374723 RepID=A0A830C5Q9_9LAMI|nr:putative DNA-binding protein escarola [Phtheirospermum japonicum]